MKIKGKRITAREMYVTYREEHKTSTLTYKEFRAIFRDIYKGATEECLKGNDFSFHAEVGTLSVIKATKHFKLDEHGNVRNLYVNHNETRKLRQQGDTETVIYYTDSFFYKWHYRKANTGSIEHKSLWSFIPTDGPLGIRRLIPAYLRKHPRAHLNYKHLIDKEDGS
jgi:hypothetical protein